MNEQKELKVRIISLCRNYSNHDLEPINNRTRHATRSGRRFTVNTQDLISENSNDSFYEIHRWGSSPITKAMMQRQTYKDREQLRYIKTLDDGKLFVHKRSHFAATRALTYGEILYCNIAKQLNVPCAEYYAVMDDAPDAREADITAMSEIVYNPKIEELVNYSKLLTKMGPTNLLFKPHSLETCFKFLDSLHGKKYNNYDLDTKLKIHPETKLRLFQMYVLDFITLQTDRRTENVHFIINKKTGQLRAAPLLDNGWLQLLQTKDVIQKEETHDGYGTPVENDDSQQESSERICEMLTRDLKLKVFDKSDYIEFNSDKTKAANILCENIVNMAAQIPSAMQFLNGLKNKLHIQEAIDKTDQDIGFDLPEIERGNVVTTATIASYMIDDTLKENKFRDIVARTTLSGTITSPTTSDKCMGS